MVWKDLDNDMTGKRIWDFRLCQDLRFGGLCLPQVRFDLLLRDFLVAPVNFASLASLFHIFTQGQHNANIVPTKVFHDMRSLEVCLELLRTTPNQKGFRRQRLDTYLATTP
jgi:hypothetical protein